MAERRIFGATWWGKAWTEALERRARFDANRLPRGRTYARHGRGQDIELSKGEINARVQGGLLRPYTVRIHVRTLTDDQWDALLDAIAAKAAHAAALLDGALDPGIVADARAVGVELLPGPGDLIPRCSCPDQAIPCKHSAAVCYLVADELDADPFALFRLRGRTRDEVLAEVRARRSAGSTRPPISLPARRRVSDPGVRATEAWSRVVSRPPRPPDPRPEPGVAASWGSDPPADAPFTGDDLRALVADAAERAWRMARGEGRSGLLDEPDPSDPGPPGA
jgi:uncharacterized Zn finger protein